MCANPVRKYAVVVNGDARELRHLENVQRAVTALKREGYEVYVANPVRVSGADHYRKGNLRDLEGLVAELNQRIDANDELVIYTTGHGGEEKTSGAGTLCLTDGCAGAPVARLLDAIRHGQRTVVMDNCYGGNWNKIFTNDPKTLFISGGSKNEIDSCQEMAPRLWAPKNTIPDLNHDGKISWQERYAHAMQPPPSHSAPQFVASAGYTQAGKAPFPATVLEVKTTGEMDRALGALRPGQYAVVTFSATWCEPCKKYEPMFHKMAGEAGGQYLFIHTNNEEIGREYHVTGYPTVMVINYQKATFVISDRERALHEIANFNLTKAQRLALLKTQLRGTDPAIRQRALGIYEGLGLNLTPKEIGEAMAEVETMLRDPDVAIRLHAIGTYSGLIDFLNHDTAQSRKDRGGKTLRAAFHDTDRNVRLTAAKNYCLLARQFSLLEAMAGVLEFRDLLADDVMSVVERLDTGSYSLPPLSNLLWRIPSTMHKVIVKMMLPALADGNATVRANALGLLGFLDTGIMEGVSEKIARAARQLLAYPDLKIRGAGVGAYSRVSETVSVAEASLGGPALRAVFLDPGPHTGVWAVQAYADLAAKLSDAEVVEGARACRAAIAGMKKTLGVSYFLRTYAVLGPRLPADEAAVAARMLRPIIGNRTWYLHEDAATAYASIAARLGAAELAAGAKAMRGVLTLDRMSQEGVWLAYAWLAPHLLPADVVEGAKAMRALLDRDAYPSAGCLYACMALAPRIPAKEAANGLAMLRRLQRRKLTDSVKTALTTAIAVFTAFAVSPPHGK